MNAPEGHERLGAGPLSMDAYIEATGAEAVTTWTTLLRRAAFHPCLDPRRQPAVDRGGVPGLTVRGVLQPASTRFQSGQPRFIVAARTINDRHIR